MKIRNFSLVQENPLAQGAQVQFEPSYPSINPITFGSIHMELNIGDHVSETKYLFAFPPLFLLAKVPFMPFCFLSNFFGAFWGLFMPRLTLSRSRYASTTQ